MNTLSSKLNEIIIYKPTSPFDVFTIKSYNTDISETTFKRQLHESHYWIVESGWLSSYWSKLLMNSLQKRSCIIPSPNVNVYFLDPEVATAFYLSNASHLADLVGSYDVSKIIVYLGVTFQFQSKDGSGPVFDECISNEFPVCVADNLLINFHVGLLDHLTKGHHFDKTFIKITDINPKMSWDHVMSRLKSIIINNPVTDEFVCARVRKAISDFCA